MIRTRHRRIELKSMSPVQLEAEWRRVFPNKKSPLNDRKKREALMLRKAPRMTPEEFIERERQKAAAAGERCHHKTPIERVCEACRVEAEAVKAYMRHNQMTDENKARSHLGLKQLPALPAPVASTPSKPLAPVTPENDPARPVMGAAEFAKEVLDVSMTPAQIAMAKEIEASKAAKRRGSK